MGPQTPIGSTARIPEPSRACTSTGKVAGRSGPSRIGRPPLTVIEVTVVSPCEESVVMVGTARTATAAPAATAHSAQEVFRMMPPVSPQPAGAPDAGPAVAVRRPATG
ncbi:hypothetical protein GCM10025734_26610 [Kitasatospora paranensis]